MDELAAREAIAQMTDPEGYQRVYAKTEGTHRCEVEGCRITQEEHHRLAFGFMTENAALKRRLRELENG